MLEIGRSLREARERRGIALPEAEAATMIRARYLEALEAERFELLPEGPYLRSFLREYAEYLGLDGDIFVAEYMRSHPPPPPPEPEAPAPNRLPLLLGDLVRRRGLLIASVLIVAVIAVWQLGSSPRNTVQPPTPPANATPAVGTPAPLAQASKDSPAHVTRPRTHAVLALTAVHGSCWLLARLRSSTGTVIAEQMLAQGQTARFGLLRPLWIRLGAPWNVEARIGKKSITGLLPTLTGNVLVTASGVQRA